MIVSFGNGNLAPITPPVSPSPAGGAGGIVSQTTTGPLESPASPATPAINPTTAKSQLATDTLLAAQALLASGQPAASSNVNDSQKSSEETEKANKEDSQQTALSADEEKDSDKSISKDEESEEGQEKKEGEGKGPNDLTPEEQALVQQLKQRDAEVKRHEQAHAAVGGQYAGAPVYEYQKGPDGRQYAIGGEVSIDASPLNDPEATIKKLRTVRRAALAPAEPSPQDQRVASQASQGIAQATADLRAEEQQAAREEAQAIEERREEQKTESQGSSSAGDNPQFGQNSSGEDGAPGNRSQQFGENGISSQQAAQAFSLTAGLTDFPKASEIEAAATAGEVAQTIARVTTI